MFKHKKFLFTLFLLPAFSLFSCQKAKEDFPIHKYSQEQTIVESRLKVTGTLTKTSYETKDNETLNLNGLVIAVNGEPQDLIAKRKNNKEAILEGGFFVCSHEDFPTNTIIGSDYKAGTNVESADFTFYIATAIKAGASYEIYVSQSFKVTIKNSGAIKPWVWFVITGVVIFGVVGMVLYTKHRKETK